MMREIHKLTKHLERVKKSNRLIFFNNFALAQGFDPLVPDNWYTVPQSTLEHYQVCPLLILFTDSAPLVTLLHRAYFLSYSFTHYLQQEYISILNGDSLSDALIKAYPSIGLVKSGFTSRMICSSTSALLILSSNSLYLISSSLK